MNLKGLVLPLILLLISPMAPAASNAPNEGMRAAVSTGVLYAHDVVQQSPAFRVSYDTTHLSIRVEDWGASQIGGTQGDTRHVRGLGVAVKGHVLEGGVFAFRDGQNGSNMAPFVGAHLSTERFEFGIDYYHAISDMPGSSHAWISWVGIAL